MDEIDGNYSPSGYIQSISHQGLGKDVDLKNVTFFLTGLILMTMIRMQCKQCIEVGWENHHVATWRNFQWLWIQHPASASVEG